LVLQVLHVVENHTLLMLLLEKKVCVLTCYIFQSILATKIIIMSAPFTTVNNKHISCFLPTTPSSNSPSVHLPAIPFLTKLGYGTGVSVFL
jgi:hypothetical protein